MIPEVTVPARPNGEPIAITASPTATFSESPSCNVGAPVTSIFSTAKSYELSRPTIFAVYFFPVDIATEMVPRVAAASTTWLFVNT